MYKVAKGTSGKLIKLIANKDAEVIDWVTRDDFEFKESLINPIVVKTMVAEAKKPLAVRMAEEGYALFGGMEGGDRTAKYVLAIPYSAITVIE